MCMQWLLHFCCCMKLYGQLVPSHSGPYTAMYELSICPHMALYYDHGPLPYSIHSASEYDQQQPVQVLVSLRHDILLLLISRQTARVCINTCNAGRKQTLAHCLCLAVARLPAGLPAAPISSCSCNRPCPSKEVLSAAGSLQACPCAESASAACHEVIAACCF